MIRDTQSNDARLLSAWTERGDRDAFETLVARYSQMVLGVCRRQCRNMADADDAFQVTFMILARSAHAIRRPDRLAAWLHATAFRVSARTDGRVHPGNRELRDPDTVAAPETQLENVNRQHAMRVLDEEIQNLPLNMREAILLHHLDGKRVADVAAETGTTVGSTRGALQRGRKELRRRLVLRGVSLGVVLGSLRINEHSACAADLTQRTIEALAHHDSLYAPQPSACDATLQTQSTPTAFLNSHSSGILMKSTHWAATAALTLTLGASQFLNEPSLPNSTDTLVVAAAPSNPALPNRVTEITPVDSKQFQFGSPQAGGGGSAQPVGSDGETQSNGGPAGGISGGSGSGGYPGGSAGGGGAGGYPGGSAGGSPLNDPFAGPAASGGGIGADPFAAGGSTADGGFGLGAGAGGAPGGSSGGGFGETSGSDSPFASSAPKTTPFEEELMAKLEEPLTFALEGGNVQELANLMQRQLQVPVIVRPYPVLDGVRMDAAISEVPPGLPASVAMKTALRPLNLRAIVRDDAILIVPDTRALARQGIGTEQFVNVDDTFAHKVIESLSTVRSLNFVEMPLNEVARTLSAELDIPTMINKRALEDLGLSEDVPASVDLNNVQLSASLFALLRPLDLTIRPRDGFIEITTVEESESTRDMVLCIHWLDGTGFQDTDTAMMLLETMVDPDMWEAVGGPGTMAPLRNSASDRIGVVVASDFETQLAIRRMLKTIRENVVDPHTDILPPSFGGGGMGGGFGGGMGGMGGGGMGGMGGGGMF